MDTTSFDLLLEEFESALHQGERPEISRYLERAADSQRSQLLRELIQIELWCRRDEFPLPGESEYRFRFPSDHPIVADAFELFGQRMLSAETMAPASQVTVSQYADDFETQVEDGSEHQRVRLSPDAPKRQFGRYRLLRELGRGGMGVVYLAHDEQLSRELALKIPTFRESVRDEMLTRFYREARAAAALRDPGICPVYDVGEIDGQSFIAMAFIEGRPLRDYTKGGKPHNATKTAWVIRRLAVAMSEAHQANIVHRDLKPANIMMEKGRRPVIMDFGLACSTTEMESSLTGTGAILGTPTYMSPEQAMGETASIGPATDIYSLGIIFYEMLAGRVPFEGNVTAVLTQIATADAKPLSEYGLDIGPAIVAIVSRMMARKVEDRFASMDEVVSELTAYLKEGAPDAEKREANDSVEDDIAPNSQSLQPLFGAVSSSVSAQNDVDQSTVRQTATDAGTTRNRPSPKKKRRPAVQTPDEEFDAVSEYDYDDYEYDVSYRSRHRDPRQSGSRKKSSQSIAVFSPMVLGGVAAGIVVLSGLYFLLFGLATSDSNVTQNRGKSGSSNDSSKSTGGAGQTVSEPSNVNSIGMRFVPIQRGTFTMVEGETAHEVTFDTGFSLGSVRGNSGAVRKSDGQ
jgi:serine/threonine protein kinase